MPQELAQSENFTYEALPGRVVFGVGASTARLAQEIERLGCERVFVIAAEPERDLARRLVAPLGDRVAATFEEVRPHVPVEVAERARAAAREAGADGLLCIGGGSTTGTAKAIALEHALPIVAVPTTYAGSEMTPVWGLTEGRRKTTGRAAAVQPAVVVYDPELTVTLPRQISGPSAMNAMAHCVEAFYAPAANPITSLMAEEGIRALARGVPVAVERPGDLGGRADTLYGAYLAGAAFAVAGSGLHHKICHALGGAFDLPHAQTHTIVLPHVVAYNAPAMPAVLERLDRVLGATGDPAGALFDLAAGIGAPMALADIGLPPGGIDEVIEPILAAVPPSNPRPVDAGGLRAVLDGAAAGARPSAAEPMKGALR
jgi:alcohol dehydrogenase class IV